MKIQYLTLLLSLAALHTAAAPLAEKSIEKETTFCINKNSCHTLEIAYPQTGNQAIDTWGITELRRTLSVKDFNEGSLKTALRRKMGIDTTAEEVADCNMNFVQRFDLDGQSENYAVLGAEIWEYACGAHGNGAHSLLVLPKQGAVKPVSLQDIVLPNQMARLQELQLAAWKQYLAAEQFSPDEIAAHLEEWKFEATSNWRFAKDGLVFLFQSYEISPYAMGRPEIFIAAKDLHGVIKPEILRETQSYFDSKNNASMISKMP